MRMKGIHDKLTQAVGEHILYFEEYNAEDHCKMTECKTEAPSAAALGKALESNLKVLEKLADMLLENQEDDSR